MAAAPALKKPRRFKDMDRVSFMGGIGSVRECVERTADSLHEPVRFGKPSVDVGVAEIDLNRHRIAESKRRDCLGISGAPQTAVSSIRRSGSRMKSCQDPPANSEKSTANL
jgi:hypothetical protein